MPPVRRALSGTAVLLVVALAPQPAGAQQRRSATLSVQVASKGKAVAGAEVRSEGLLAITDSAGRTELRLASGRHRIRVWQVGFAADTVPVTLKPGRDTTVFIELTPVAMELAPIVVQATRVQSLLSDQPERVEVLASEDVNEKTLMAPGNMTDLLVEMGGVRIERDAPGLGGAAVRIQGLPGQYTLLLRDGLPLHGEHPPAFSLVQTPPLDLKQVEVIKGAATALYGPSALGGVVDLISRRPANDREVVLSQNSHDGSDALFWLSRRVSPRWGYTFLAGAHRQDREDVSGNGWADVPGYRRVEARPRFFWNGRDGSSLLVTTGGVWESRRGGTLPGAVVPSGSPFAEDLRTRHLDAGLLGGLAMAHGMRLGARAAAVGTWYDRTFGGTTEHDRLSTLSGEATLSLVRARHQAVFGLAAARDGLRTEPRAVLDHDFTTLSLFAQDTYTPLARLSLGASARLDRHSRYGTFFSPRLSILYRAGGGWNVRASAGAGFLAPTVASGETQEVGFARLVQGPPIGASRGQSASLDVNGTLGPIQVTGTLFGVRVEDPLLPRPVVGDSTRFELVNAPGPIRSVGTEVFAVWASDPFLLTATYSHTAATELSLEAGARIAVPLDPRNAGGVDIAWEDDDPGESGFRTALEVYYTGRQRVEDDPYRTFTPGYTTVDLLLSKRFRRFTVFANAEDLTDVRQTHWDPLLRPSPGLGGRWTTDEWAPLGGRVLNAGIRARF